MSDQVITVLISSGIVVIGWVVTAAISYRRDKAYNKYIEANNVLDNAIQILLSLKNDWAQIKEQAFWNKMELTKVSLLRISRKSVYIAWCAIEERLLDYLEASDRFSKQIDNEVELSLDSLGDTRTREEIEKQITADYENSNRTIAPSPPSIDACIHQLISAEIKPYGSFIKMLIAGATSRLLRESTSK